jgi:hypothetical protein
MFCAEIGDKTGGAWTVNYGEAHPRLSHKFIVYFHNGSALVLLIRDGGTHC